MYNGAPLKKQRWNESLQNWFELEEEEEDIEFSKSLPGGETFIYPRNLDEGYQVCGAVRVAACVAVCAVVCVLQCVLQFVLQCMLQCVFMGGETFFLKNLDRGCQILQRVVQCVLQCVLQWCCSADCIV